MNELLERLLTMMCLFVDYFWVVAASSAVQSESNIMYLLVGNKQWNPSHSSSLHTLQMILLADACVTRPKDETYE